MLLLGYVAEDVVYIAVAGLNFFYFLAFSLAASQLVKGLLGTLSDLECSWIIYMIRLGPSYLDNMADKGLSGGLPWIMDNSLFYFEGIGNFLFQAL